MSGPRHLVLVPNTHWDREWYRTREEFHSDRLLLRYVEPLAAWLGELGGDPDTGMLGLVWRMALESHPHDSMCGCSTRRRAPAASARAGGARGLERIDLRGRPIPGRGLETAAEGSVELDLRPWELAALRPLPIPT